MKAPLLLREQEEETSLTDPLLVKPRPWREHTVDPFDDSDAEGFSSWWAAAECGDAANSPRRASPGKHRANHNWVAAASGLAAQLGSVAMDGVAGTVGYGEGCATRRTLPEGLGLPGPPELRHPFAVHAACGGPGSPAAGADTDGAMAKRWVEPGIREGSGGGGARAGRRRGRGTSPASSAARAEERRATRALPEPSSTLPAKAQRYPGVKASPPHRGWDNAHLDPVPWGPEIVTVMVRQIPRIFTQKMLLQEVANRGFRGLFDFMYLPYDLKKGINVGYGFFNFTEPRHAQAFREALDGAYLDRHMLLRGRPVRVHPAAVQGYEANFQHFARTKTGQKQDPCFSPIFLRGNCLSELETTDQTLNAELAELQRQLSKGNSAQWPQQGAKQQQAQHHGEGQTTDNYKYEDGVQQPEPHWRLVNGQRPRAPRGSRRQRHPQPQCAQQFQPQAPLSPQQKNELRQRHGQQHHQHEQHEQQQQQHEQQQQQQQPPHTPPQRHVAPMVRWWLPSVEPVPNKVLDGAGSNIYGTPPSPSAVPAWWGAGREAAPQPRQDHTYGENVVKKDAAGQEPGWLADALGMN